MLAAPSASSSPLSALISDPAFSDVLEKRQFQFFRLNTVPGTNYLIDSRFWDHVVLQACHSTPAVKHGVLALSFWHQSFDHSALNDSESSRSRQYANMHYQLGLEQAQTLLNHTTEDDVNPVLIACIVFSLYEAVRGDHAGSQKHLNNGHAIIHQYNGKLRSSRRYDSQEIQQLFARLDVSYWDSTPLHVPGTLEQLAEATPSSWEFQRLSEAKTAMFDLARWLMVARIDHLDDAADDEDVYAACVAERRKCLSVLHAWKQHFDSLIGQTDIAASSDLVVLHLEMLFNIGLILTQVDPRAPETQYDAFLPQFEKVVSCAEQIVEMLLLEPPQQTRFSYEAGYVMVLFSTAVRCREPKLRRRAVQILRALGRREGLWDSKSAAEIADQIIVFEEEGLESAEFTADIPESKRVLLMDIELGPTTACAIGQRSCEDLEADVLRFRGS